MHHAMNHSSQNQFFGFWLYLMSDVVLFSALFATFAVLRGSTYGALSGKELFDLPFVLKETLVLLTSSFTMGLAVLASQRGRRWLTLLSLLATLGLGFTFLSFELSEFSRFIASGAGPQASAFLSSFFTLVGTHGLHVLAGTIWMLVVILHLLIRGLTPSTTRKLVYLSLFWHFLDVVWIFIFTLVYLMGVYS